MRTVKCLLRPAVKADLDQVGSMLPWQAFLQEFYAHASSDVVMLVLFRGYPEDKNDVNRQIVHFVRSNKVFII